MASQPLEGKVFEERRNLHQFSELADPAPLNLTGSFTSCTQHLGQETEIMTQGRNKVCWIGCLSCESHSSVTEPLEELGGGKPLRYHSTTETLQSWSQKDNLHTAKPFLFVALGSCSESVCLIKCTLQAAPTQKQFCPDI